MLVYHNFYFRVCLTRRAKWLAKNYVIDGTTDNGQFEKVSTKGSLCLFVKRNGYFQLVRYHIISSRSSHLRQKQNAAEPHLQTHYGSYGAYYICIVTIYQTQSSTTGRDHTAWSLKSKSCPTPCGKLSLFISCSPNFHNYVRNHFCNYVHV